MFSLKAEVAAHPESALKAFWSEVHARGSPRVEPLEGDATRRWVTFVWRGEPSTRSVTVHASLDGPLEGTGLMSHLGGTDVWYRSYRVPQDARVAYSFGINEAPFRPGEAWEDGSAWKPDPLNPRTYVIPKDDEDPTDHDIHQSVLELPGAPRQLDLTRASGVAEGKVVLYRIRSATLKNERRVWVYTPATPANPRAPMELLVLFDGGLYLHPIPTPVLLDNLISQKRIPPMVVVFVDSLGEARGRELPCFPPFARFLAEELMPWIHARYPVSRLPSAVTLGGSSYGGLAAAYVALEHPETFGNVLSQSGAFWWAPDADPEAEWLTRRIATMPAQPVKFFLGVGRLENGPIPGGRPNQLVVNRHLRDVLTAKRYRVRYRESGGAHQYLDWQGTLADGLVALHAPP